MNNLHEAHCILVGLAQDLEDLLQAKVDVLTDASIHPALRARILTDLRPL